MKEVTCFSCKQLQKLTKNNFCTYCHTPFQKVKEQNGLEKFEELKPKLNSKKLLFSFGILALISLIFYIIDLNSFAWAVDRDNPIFLIAFLTSISSFFIHKWLSAKYDLKDYILTSFKRGRGGRDLSVFERYLSFYLTLFIFNSVLIGINIVVLNDFSSRFTQRKVHRIFLMDKYQKRSSKGGVSHYAVFTSWRNDKSKALTLRVSKNNWQWLVPNMPYKIEIRNGFLSEVIWGVSRDF